MANTRPIKPSTDPNLVIERFQSGDAVDPNYGGTGLTNTELAGNVGKVLAVNATADGYTLTTAGGGGGGSVDSVSGDCVDNTDPVNPIVNAIPLDVAGGAVTAYAGSSVWRTSVPFGDYYEGGIAWNKFMDKNTAILDNKDGAFCWYSGTDGGVRSLFQSNPEEGYFEFGGTSPGSSYAYLRASADSVTMQAAGSGSGSTVQARAGGVIAFSASQYFDFGYSGAIVFPRMVEVERDAMTPDVGWTIYCTDATANDTSTGVMQTYNGSTWKNHW